jgi:hypothetical protein
MRDRLCRITQIRGARGSPWKAPDLRLSRLAPSRYDMFVSHDNTIAPGTDICEMSVLDSVLLVRLRQHDRDGAGSWIKSRARGGRHVPQVIFRCWLLPHGPCLIILKISDAITYDTPRFLGLCLCPEHTLVCRQGRLPILSSSCRLLIRSSQRSAEPRRMNGILRMAGSETPQEESTWC